MIDMNQMLSNYEPGKPEYKPKLMEQLKQIEDERNKRLLEHNKMLESQQRLLQKERERNGGTKELDAMRNHYEKQLADKSYLINELLKKVKELTVELADYKDKDKK